MSVVLNTSKVRVIHIGEMRIIPIEIRVERKVLLSDSEMIGLPTEKERGDNTTY